MIRLAAKGGICVERGIRISSIPIRASFPKSFNRLIHSNGLWRNEPLRPFYLNGSYHSYIYALNISKRSFSLASSLFTTIAPTPSNDKKKLQRVVKLLSLNMYEDAFQMLEKVKQPELEKEKCYSLYWYLLYMTERLQKLPQEDIERILKRCGMTDEDMAHRFASLSNPITQEAFIEYCRGDELSRGLEVVGAILAILLMLMLYRVSQGGSILGATNYLPETGIHTRFSDVIGLGESLEEVQLLVKYLRDPAQFTALGAKYPTGVLLTGPPGTGKTLLARAVAGEAGVPFFFAAGSEFDDMFVGTGAKNVRELFEKARENAPCIVFIDELDAVGGRRDSFRNGNSRQTVNQLLNEIGGFKGDEGVLVMGATNLKSVLDPALTRAGRFDLEIRTNLPDRAAREQILRKKTQNTRLADDVDIVALSKRSVSMSGADLENLVNIAALKALSSGYLRIHNAHFVEAFDRMTMGNQGQRGNMKDVERLTLLHECGHALLSLLTPGAGPIDKITVIPRGDALGYVAPLVEEKDLYGQTRQELIARMDVCMAGRAAEAVFYGDSKVTTGASSDLQQASSVARAIVYTYGLNQSLRVRGSVSNHAPDQLPYYSEEEKRKKDIEIAKLLNDSYTRAITVIQANKDKLLALADAVEEYETISGEDAKRILHGERMQDVYNVEHIVKSDDDYHDEEIYAASKPPEEKSIEYTVDENADMSNAKRKVLQEWKKQDEKIAAIEKEIGDDKKKVKIVRGPLEEDVYHMFVMEMQQERKKEEQQIIELLVRAKLGLTKEEKSDSPEREKSQ